jgi:hypothetical protein
MDHVQGEEAEMKFEEFVSSWETTVEVRKQVKTCCTDTIEKVVKEEAGKAEEIREIVRKSIEGKIRAQLQKVMHNDK